MRDSARGPHGRELALLGLDGMGKDNQPTALQSISLLNEVKTAVGLLLYGLASLQSLGLAQDFYHLPLLLLASGFERLCKCALCTMYLTHKGCFPSKMMMKGFGHDLVELVDRVSTECYSDEYLRLPAAKEDLAFLKDDAVLREFVRVLGHFGKQGRYHDLNLVCDGTADTESPELAWQRLELTILRASGRDVAEFEDMTMDEAREATRQVTDRIVVIFERLARALGRLFTLGPLRRHGIATSVWTKVFLFLTDSKLGTVDYRERIHLG